MVKKNTKHVAPVHITPTLLCTSNQCLKGNNEQLMPTIEKVFCEEKINIGSHSQRRSTKPPSSSSSLQSVLQGKDALQKILFSATNHIEKQLLSPLLPWGKRSNLIWCLQIVVFHVDEGVGIGYCSVNWWCNTICTSKLLPNQPQFMLKNWAI